MIKSPLLLAASFVLFLISFLLRFPFSSLQAPEMEIILTRHLNLAFHLSILSHVLMIASVTVLWFALKRFQLLTVTIAFVLVLSSPALAVDFYQKFMAEGVEKVNYIADDSVCMFDVPDWDNPRTMTADCEMTFENNGNEDLTFTYSFDENNYKPVPLLNQGAPFHAKLKAKEKKTIRFSTMIEAPEGADGHIGGVQGPRIILYTGMGQGDRSTVPE
ncbi:hypothetical protein AS034_15985 [[Bacillus] enclensis]|uniref:Uncharacterized protein n=1 Tax=[Bacillus] enclensis TaxID=1402860 RepID=A0A0V8HCU3_9BACI|nr:hypothetical protein [[Bacillus] enclensis]KSU60342.1 hypothetical protein AS034_15985 [[Bacillus] enclensis]SCC23379.1 hypothetical protein GA0061094_3306 [[Bacillus] enclensis]